MQIGFSFSSLAVFFRPHSLPYYSTAAIMCTVHYSVLSNTMNMTGEEPCREVKKKKKKRLKKKRKTHNQTEPADRLTKKWDAKWLLINI